MNCKKAKFIWNKDATVALIDLYQNEQILYNISNSDYKNKMKREAAITKIKNELLKLSFCQAQCLNEDDVRSKIHTPKVNSYPNKEYKKRAESLRTGAGSLEVYTPALWCYDNLLFLKDIDDISVSTCNLESMDLVPETGIVEETTGEAAESESELIFEGTVEDFNEELISPTSMSSGPTARRQPSIQREVAKLISNATNTLKERGKNMEQDDICSSSRLVETKMRKIRNQKRLRALQKCFMDAMFMAEEEEEEERNNV